MKFDFIGLNLMILVYILFKMKIVLNICCYRKEEISPGNGSGSSSLVKRAFLYILFTYCLS